MKKVWVLFIREFQAYFYSPMAYVVLTTFLIISGYFFSMILAATEEASLRYTFSNMAITLLFICPLITMRLLAEERKSGTIETLMTDPVREVEVVLGKFFAALLFYIMLLIPTCGYIIILRLVGNPDTGPIISGYIGLVLMGTVFISIGVLASSLSKNQIVAGVITLTSLLLLWVIGWAGELNTGVFAKTLLYLGFFDHFQSLQKGIIDTKDVIYYISTAVLFLFLTVRTLEARKWK